VAFKGDLYDHLWQAMGVQTDENGVQRHGQSCFLYVFPVGADTTRKEITEALGDGDKLGAGDINDATENPAIDHVISCVFDMGIGPESVANVAPGELYQYDGLRAGAGWIYAALHVAKTYGATQASVAVATNDGNLEMTALDKDKGVLVYARHHVYYGT
jgi:hypothetical protein